ncbi:probable chitinase [Heterostelium album PN500]|uniref:Probable chitinase n=1 Tax=Heterostelium pallidum (strain ATCC 26659 / Pp 5 / PN500) TaxID=670386 RepID=D3B773_HETP5|nr:probable chitinase [Heterostelium album PN500]EFA82616.1 probable chitinase [Heterostelium album PN500]|eukprot:XP_020434733.1 probable chitinase [Heterostelium album PN500]
MYRATIGCLLLLCVALINAQSVSYDFSVPYVGGHQLSIKNSGSGNIVMAKLIFESNAVISGTPYGDLWNNNAAISSTSSGNGVTYIYTVTWGTSGFTLSSGQSSSMTYTFSNNGGPLQPLGMNPISVSVVPKGASNPITAGVEGACKGSACNNPTPGYRVVGYYTDWDMYERSYLPSDLPIDKINEVNYAFLNFDLDGNLVLYDTNSDPQQLPRLSLLKQQYPYLRLYLSIGGWTLSNDFSTVAASTSATQNFAKQCADALIQTGFDGIDIDWEYPVVREGSPADAKNFPNFLSAIREAIDAAAQSESLRTGAAVKYYLSFAASAGIDKIEAVSKLNPGAWAQVQQAVDFANVMAYDFHGAFDEPNPSDFLAPLYISPHDPYIDNATIGKYDCNDGMNDWINVGFNKSQLALGIPLYGRSVTVQSMGNTHGLWQPITGCPSGEFDSTGLFDYRCIIAGECYGSPLPAGTTLLPAAQNPIANYSMEPIGYNPSGNFFISYDDAASATIKATFVVTRGYNGIMMWTYSGDVPINNPNSIINAVYKVFTNTN